MPKLRAYFDVAGEHTPWSIRFERLGDLFMPGNLFSLQDEWTYRD